MDQCFSIDEDRNLGRLLLTDHNRCPWTLWRRIRTGDTWLGSWRGELRALHSNSDSARVPNPRCLGTLCSIRTHGRVLRLSPLEDLPRS
jgi:hypothetical protein